MRAGSRHYSFAEFELDAEKPELRRSGAPVLIHLTPLRVLAYLVEHRDRTVPKRELLEHIWSKPHAGESSLTTAIYEARQALGDPRGERRFIRTERGHGYRFIANGEWSACSSGPFSGSTVTRLVPSGQLQSGDD